MQLSTVKDVLEHEGPYVSIHAEVSRHTEDAAQQLDARWRSIRSHLEEEGIDEATMQVLEDALREKPDVPGEVWATVVAAAGGEIVLHDVRAGHSTWPEGVEIGPLPDIAGLVTVTDGDVPFVLAVVDRQGADIEAYRDLGRPTVDEREVHGHDSFITKVGQGWLSHRQHHNFVEENWKDNARDVADAIASVAREHRPEVIVLAGDERARTEVTDALQRGPVNTVDVVHVTAGGRADGASQDALWEEVRRVLAAYEADALADLIERLTRARADGQGQAGVHGLVPVLDALVKGQAETVVVDLHAAREASVRPSDHPGLPLPTGVDTDHPLPADQVLIAAAAATDAAVATLDAGHTGGDGIAALLRWSDD